MKSDKTDKDLDQRTIHFTRRAFASLSAKATEGKDINWGYIFDITMARGAVLTKLGDVGEDLLHVEKFTNKQLAEFVGKGYSLMFEDIQQKLWNGDKDAALEQIKAFASENWALRKLGYMTSGSGNKIVRFKPKDFKNKEIHELFRKGKTGKAMELIRKVILDEDDE